MFRFGSQRLGNFLVSMNHEDLVFLTDMIEAGKVTPVMDRGFALSDTSEAMAHVGAGHAQGKTTITVFSSLAADASSAPVVPAPA